VNIAYKFKGKKRFIDKMTTAHRRMKSTRGLYKAFGIETVKWIMKTFRRGGPPHAKWPRLSPLTIMGRRSGTKRPLQDTGHMMRQWSYRATSRQAVIGNPMQIAAWHHEGYRVPPLKPVRKKVLWFGVPPVTRRAAQAGRFHKAGIFAMSTKGATVPPRRQLPTDREIVPTLIKTADVFIQKAIR
jgi:phage gpG-like protein